VGARVEIDLKLELGAVSETVSVVAEVPLLDSDSASSGRVMDSHILNDVPVLNNMSLLLAEMTPGVQSAGVNSWVSYHSGGGGLVYSINGGVGGNDFAIDGAANNSGRGAAFIPHTETISEFKRETSGFDASMGHSTGITVSMMTKAGTNQKHGTVNWQYWTNRLNGADYYKQQVFDANRATEKIFEDGRSNNLSLTFGGPLSIPKVIDGRNKLFMFLNYSYGNDLLPGKSGTKRP